MPARSVVISRNNGAIGLPIKLHKPAIASWVFTIRLVAQLY